MQAERGQLWMLIIKVVLLVLIGLSAGFIASAGMFAFITMIGVIPALAKRTKTSRSIPAYENSVFFGALFGNLFSIFQFSLPVGYVGLTIFGFFSGVFVGCLALALAEALDVIPIFSMRVKLVKGLAFIVLALALGKAFGAYYQFIINR